MGALPGNLRSHLLKAAQFDYMRKMGDRQSSSSPVNVDPAANSEALHLNQISELPEEDDVKAHIPEPSQ